MADSACDTWWPGVKHRTRWRWMPSALAAAALVCAAAWPADASLDPNQVLLVYNSANADSQAVRDHYVNARPGVLEFDLNDPTLGNGNIEYAEFVTQVRDPLRAHLQANGLQSQVTAMTLTTGIPHRIRDTDAPIVGDQPNNAISEFFTSLDATYASVDSELTLLWQPLDDGESGGSRDSLSDNLVLNPYHKQTASIDSFDRSGIAAGNNAYQWMEPAWKMLTNGQPATGGDIYLVTRLDGKNVADINASIDRAANIVYNANTDYVILDEDTTGRDDVSFFDDPDEDTPGYAGDDYAEAAAALAGVYNAVLHETTNTFVEGATGSSGANKTQPFDGSVAVLSTFGTNHGPGSGVTEDYVDTFAGQFVDGAIFNSLESWNGRRLGSVGSDKSQEQIADFIAAGGTLGVANVWEPFAASVPDTELLLDNFLNNGMTWAEAAYSAIPWLSWQQIVIGDPLATARVFDAALGDVNKDNEIDADDIDLLFDAIADDPGDGQFDLNGDGAIDLDDVRLLIGHDTDGSGITGGILDTYFGDANLDGAADLTDLTIIGINFNEAGGWADGDFNGDGWINLADLTLLGSNFNLGTGSLPAVAAGDVAVPEPGSAAMVAACAAGLVARRRRRG